MKRIDLSYSFKMATVESPLLPSTSREPCVEDAERSSIREGRWAHLRSKSSKVLTVYWTFLIMGAGDAAYGVSNLECMAIR